MRFSVPRDRAGDLAGRRAAPMPQFPGAGGYAEINLRAPGNPVIVSRRLQGPSASSPIAPIRFLPRENMMSALKRVWRSAQLFVGFHRDRTGRKRESVKIWQPTDGSASIDPNPDEREALMIVRSGDTEQPRDVQVRLQPDRIMFRRDQGAGWNRIIVEETGVAVEIDGSWIVIRADGSVSREQGGDLTFLESDGAVLKTTGSVEAMMSGDGVELTRRTRTTIAAISEDGILAAPRVRGSTPDDR